MPTPWGYDYLYRVRSVRDVTLAAHQHHVAFLLTTVGSLITTPLERRLRVDQSESN